MTRPATDTTPDAVPPVVLDYASPQNRTNAPTMERLIVVVVGSVTTAWFFSLTPTLNLDSYWPWSAFAGIGLLLLGVILFFSVGRRARLMRGRKFSLVGLLLSSIGVTAMCGSVLVQKSTTHCWISPRTSCSRNLRMIGQVMYMYAQDEEDGAFPDDLSKLVKAGQITLKTFTCPSDAPNASSYHYVPGYGINSGFTQIIMYENPGHHGGKGGNVLYQDCHTAFIKSPQFEQLIDAITLPDGRPYDPDAD